MKHRKLRTGLVIVATFLLANFGSTSTVVHRHQKKISRSLKRSSSQSRLQQEISELEARYPGQIGLYIKDLNSGEEFSLHSEENWYLASTVKVPVAMEVLAQVDAKKISLEDLVEITTEDFVDGNGPLKKMKPGEKVTIRYLIEQMIIWSDNIATDMLIRVAGLDRVNTFVQKVGNGFAPITTLKDVRRKIYSRVHPGALDLPSSGIVELGNIGDPAQKLKKLATLLKLESAQVAGKSLPVAYDEYYTSGLNSASPRTYSKVLESLWDGQSLSPESREFLIQTMLKTETGKNRIQAGLRKPLTFAHKTGTQFQRLNDVGFILNPEKPEMKPVIVVAFVRGITDQKKSARVLQDIGHVISRAGFL